MHAFGHCLGPNGPAGGPVANLLTSDRSHFALDEVQRADSYIIVHNPAGELENESPRQKKYYLGWQPADWPPGWAGPLGGVGPALARPAGPRLN